MLLFGDSMAHLKIAPYYRDLIEHFGFGGFWASSTGQQIYSIYWQNAGARSSYVRDDFERAITGLVYLVEEGGWIDIKRAPPDRVPPGRLPADRFHLFFAREPNGGVVEVQYATTVSPDTFEAVPVLGSIATDGPRLEMGQVTFSLPKGEYHFRIRCRSGLARIVGFYLENSDGGVCFQEMRFGGISLRDMNGFSLAGLEVLLGVLRPQIAVFDMRDDLAALVGDLELHHQRFNALVPGMDWIYSGHEQPGQAHNAILSGFAESHQAGFWRVFEALPASQWPALNWLGDGVHLTDTANEYLGGLLLSELGVTGILETYRTWRARAFSPQAFSQPSGTEPFDDFDEDGASNDAERQAGTNPELASDSFRVRALEVANSERISVAWESNGERNYEIQYRATLDDFGDELLANGEFDLGTSLPPPGWQLVGGEEWFAVATSESADEPALRVMPGAQIMESGSFDAEVPAEEFAGHYGPAWKRHNGAAAWTSHQEVTVQRGTVGGSTSGIYQRVIVVPGRRYRFRCVMRNGSGAPYLRLGRELFSGEYFSSAALAYPSFPLPAEQVVEFVSAGTELHVSLSCTTGPGDTAHFSGFTLYRADLPLADAPELGIVSDPVFYPGETYQIRLRFASETPGGVFSLRAPELGPIFRAVSAVAGAMTLQTESFEYRHQGAPAARLMIRNELSAAAWELLGVSVRRSDPWQPLASITGTNQVALDATAFNAGAIPSQGFFRIKLK